jgi:hypothetical protein
VEELVPQFTRKRRARWALAATALLGLVGAQLVSATWASATTGPVQAGTARSSSSAGPKFLTVRCPQGTTAVNAAATISPPTPGVVIDELMPFDGEVHIHASPLGRVTTRWRINGTALCVQRAPDIEYVGAQAISPSENEQMANAFANCPAGKTAIGAGAWAIGGYLTSLDFDGNGFGNYSVLVTGGPANVLGANVVCASRDNVFSTSYPGGDVTVVPGLGTTVTVSGACPSATIHAIEFGVKSWSADDPAILIGISVDLASQTQTLSMTRLSGPDTAATPTVGALCGP